MTVVFHQFYAHKIKLYGKGIWKVWNICIQSLNNLYDSMKVSLDLGTIVLLETQNIDFKHVMLYLNT